MRDDVVHAYKPSVEGNGLIASPAGTNVSVAVTVPFPSAPEYNGVARILNTIASVAFVRRSSLAASPTPATSADIPCPQNVVCYIQLDSDTKFLSVFSAGTGSVFVGIGTGGLSA